MRESINDCANILLTRGDLNIIMSALDDSADECKKRLNDIKTDFDPHHGKEITKQNIKDLQSVKMKLENVEMQLEVIK